MGSISATKHNPSFMGEISTSPHLWVFQFKKHQTCGRFLNITTSVGAFLPSGPFLVVARKPRPMPKPGLDALSWIKCVAQTTFKQKVMFLEKISNIDHIHPYQIQSFLWNLKCWHFFPQFPHHHICWCFVAFTVTVVVFRHLGRHQARLVTTSSSISHNSVFSIFLPPSAGRHLADGDVS